MLGTSRFSLSMNRDEQADAGRDFQTRLARPNSQARERGQGNIHFSCSADHEQDWQPYPVDPYTLAMICDDHALVPLSIFDTRGRNIGHVYIIYEYLHSI